MRMREEFICLGCKESIVSYKSNPRYPRQCPHCDCCDLVTREEFNGYVDRAQHLIEHTPLGAAPMWDVIRAIFEKKPFLRKRYRLGSVLNLEEMIAKELEKRGVKFRVK